MPRMRRKRRLGNRGILLISSYLVLSLFLVYSSAMTLRTMYIRSWLASRCKMTWQRGSSRRLATERERYGKSA